ncbi:MAG: flagellar protein export ATPase FliI [Alphaproteobacteria bacterium]|nr:flagellar protein export ATPase FliI [Alphaproteobacteria bacterium]
MLASAIREVKALEPRRFEGRVTALEGLRIEASGPAEALKLGASVRFATRDGPRGELVGFEGERAIILACDPLEGLGLGAPVLFSAGVDFVRPSDTWLGRVIDAFAEPLDGLGPLRAGLRQRPVRSIAPNAQSRARVQDRLALGVKAIDVFAPCATGQRLGVFAGSGVGKSTLMSMLARNAEADVVVIGLIGERGREVREFVEDTLGPEGLKRSVIVTATSDEAAPRRRRAAWLTLAVAEHFRDEGKKVICFLDSVTRFAMAQREIGLAAGEPPTTRGYTPSVFAELPKLLERAGPGVIAAPGEPQGHITGLFTVLVDGDDHNEPVADAVRAILDGHVTLSRAIAERGRFPSVDVLRSISRLTQLLYTADEKQIATRARRLLALYANMEELVRIGAYAKGADPEVDEAVSLWPKIEAFLNQDTNEGVLPSDAFASLDAILRSGAPLQQPVLQQPSNQRNAAGAGGR